MKNTKIINGLGLTREKSLHETPSKLNNFSRKPDCHPVFDPRLRAVKMLLLSVIFAIAALIGFTIISCDDGGKSCSHKWVWKVTTHAVIGAPGLETESCDKCGVKSGKTKTIEQLTGSGGNEDDEKLTGSGNEDDEQLSGSGNEDDEKLTGSVEEDDEQLTGSGDEDRLIVINISSIMGVSPPESGALPVLEIQETTQFTGIVSWSYSSTGFVNEIKNQGNDFVLINHDDDAFINEINDQETELDLSDNTVEIITSGKTYIATITLTAKDGYTLQGVKANFFTVAKTLTPATNAANSGVITAVFPSTRSPVSKLPLYIKPTLITEYDPDFIPGTLVSVINADSYVMWDLARQYIIKGSENSNYIINVTGDFSAPGSGMTSDSGLDGEKTFGSVKNVKISLRGNSTISLRIEFGKKGALILLSESQTVYMHDLTLQGAIGNYRALVDIPDGAAFIMHSGKITGNSNTSLLHSDVKGGGVRNEGTFIMNGGVISDNIVSSGSNNAYGAGVMNDGGYFIMNNGIIYRNHSEGENSVGGGIANVSGIVRITNCSVYGNNNGEDSNTAGEGAALYLSDGTIECGFFNEVNGGWIKKSNAKTMNNSITIINGIRLIEIMY